MLKKFGKVREHHQQHIESLTVSISAVASVSLSVGLLCALSSVLAFAGVPLAVVHSRCCCCYNLQTAQRDCELKANVVEANLALVEQV